MANKNFDIIAKEHFSFLESEFGFKLSSCKKMAWGFELIYMNALTGIKITYEFREAYIFIMLYKLVEGKLRENPTLIENSSVLYGYMFDDLIKLRNAGDLVKPVYEYGEHSEYYDKDLGLGSYISAFANNLKIYAGDVLGGNFEIFPELEKIVKKRIQRD